MTKHILIAGPTASGKSAVALDLADKLDGIIVNADASQVYDHWRVLTARPSAAEETRADHRLYGHVPFQRNYSVGDWLREIQEIIGQSRRLIIVGGTGLYLTALTTGLAEIPEIPTQIRREADAHRAREGLAGLQNYVAQFDPVLFARVDRNNPMRLQRAMEVHRATGTPLSEWQENTPPPILPLSETIPLVLDAHRDWLAQRISQRFDIMLRTGALEEVRAVEACWDPNLPAAKALGAAELREALNGRMPMEDAVNKAKIATRQYAKRQRSWFRSNMAAWHKIPAEDWQQPLRTILRDSGAAP